MGMYTELILGAKLKSETPQEVIDTINYLCNPRRVLPPQFWPFKSETRMQWLFTCGSYYFGVTRAVEPYFEFDNNGKNWVIATRSNIKNYDNEIEEFLAWLKPYIEQGSGIRNFYAIVTYEEAEEPTIYYLNEKEV